jgi:hypothetical protein
MAPAPGASYGGYGGYGGGRGGGGGSNIAPTPAVPSPAGELNWWGADQVPVQIRDWATWFRNLYTQSQMTGGLPWIFSALENMNSEDPSSKQLRMLMEMLGLSLDPSADPTQKWQAFINALLKAPLGAQQLLSGLDYDSTNSRWFFKDVPQLYNLEYL